MNVTKIPQRAQFWRNLSENCESLSIKKFWEELCEDLLSDYVSCILKELADTGVYCLDIYQMHIHVTWLGIEDWVQIS